MRGDDVGGTIKKTLRISWRTKDSTWGKLKDKYVELFHDWKMRFWSLIKSESALNYARDLEMLFFLRWSRGRVMCWGSLIKLFRDRDEMYHKTPRRSRRWMKRSLKSPLKVSKKTSFLVWKSDVVIDSDSNTLSQNQKYPVCAVGITWRPWWMDRRMCLYQVIRMWAWCCWNQAFWPKLQPRSMDPSLKR